MEAIQEQKKPETIQEKFDAIISLVDVFFQNSKTPREVVVEADGYIKELRAFIEKNGK